MMGKDKAQGFPSLFFCEWKKYLLEMRGGIALQRGRLARVRAL